MCTTISIKSQQQYVQTKWGEDGRLRHTHYEVGLRRGGHMERTSKAERKWEWGRGGEGEGWGWNGNGDGNGDWDSEVTDVAGVSALEKERRQRRCLFADDADEEVKLCSLHPFQRSPYANVQWAMGMGNGAFPCAKPPCPITVSVQVSFPTGGGSRCWTTDFCALAVNAGSRPKGGW